MAYVGQVFFGSLPCEEVAPGGAMPQPALWPTDTAGGSAVPESSPNSGSPSTAGRPLQPLGSAKATRRGPCKGLAALSHNQGPISKLQEFIQSSRVFPVTRNRSILEWDFETRTSQSSVQEFKATVCFVFEGVPHRMAGVWRSSKKLAQRDAADRALSLLTKRWLHQHQSPVCDVTQESLAASTAPPASPDLGAMVEEVRLLEAYCAALAAAPGGAPADTGPPSLNWSVSREAEGAYRASFEVEILGVPHCFYGAVADTLEAATAETARRALWYFQLPKYEDAFVPPGAGDSLRAAPAAELPPATGAPGPGQTPTPPDTGLLGQTFGLSARWPEERGSHQGAAGTRRRAPQPDTGSMGQMFGLSARWPQATVGESKWKEQVHAGVGGQVLDRPGLQKLCGA